MKKWSLLLFFIAFSWIGKAQTPQLNTEEEAGTKTSNRKFSLKKEKKEKPSITLYQIISTERDTTYLDTTISIRKDYKFNYLRKDNFELEPLANVGPPFVQLAKQNKHFEVMPHFGARLKHLGYLEANVINYYRVPTPLTELYYKTAMEQGQQLDAFITVNIFPNLNFSLAYKGVRSLGDYQRSLTSTKSFRSTLSYQTTNGKYKAKAHFTDQTLLNEENGGISSQEIQRFLSRDDNFKNRATFESNFDNTENELEGKRLYMDHEYLLLAKDSLQSNQISIQHKLEFTTKQYTFSESLVASEFFFGKARTSSGFRDKTELAYLSNKLGIRYLNDNLGDLSFYAKYSTYNYGYNNVIINSNLIEDASGNLSVVETGQIKNRLKGNIVSLIGNYKNTYKGFLLEGNTEISIVGDFKNQHFFGQVGYKHKNNIAFKFGYRLASEAPNYNLLLNQSNFINYNWQNNFSNVVTNTLSFKLDSGKRFNFKASYSVINNYSFFGRRQLESTAIGVNPIFVSTPQQTSEAVNLFKIKGFKEFRYKKFRLANTLLFQQPVTNNVTSIYNVPTFTTRNSLYYQNHIFKKAMFLQTGINFKYFTKYFVDGYDPLLSENFVQNDQKFGGIPSLDIFANGKVRQTRIFLKFENVQWLLKQNDELLLPNYASRDFQVRFGIVWNFFL